MKKNEVKIFFLALLFEYLLVFLHTFKTDGLPLWMLKRKKTVDIKADLSILIKRRCHV